MTSQHERVFWAAVFSVPPAAGIALATAKVGPRTLAAPIVVGAFLVVATVMFSLVYVAVGAGDGATAEDAEGGESALVGDEEWSDG